MKKNTPSSTRTQQGWLALAMALVLVAAVKIWILPLFSSSAPTKPVSTSPAEQQEIVAFEQQRLRDSLANVPTKRSMPNGKRRKLHARHSVRRNKHATTALCAAVRKSSPKGRNWMLMLPTLRSGSACLGWDVPMPKPSCAIDNDLVASSPPHNFTTSTDCPTTSTAMSLLLPTPQCTASL